jgi:cold shock CspA family protein
MNAPTKPTRLHGSVARWIEPRGFGFVAADDGREFFAHISQIVSGDPLRVGWRVSFLIDKGRDGRPIARQVLVEG